MKILDKIYNKTLEYCAILCYPVFRICNSNGVNNMKGEEVTVFDVANFFRSKESMTQKKLQKLTYYAYVQYIIQYNNADNVSRTLFREKPEAWIHGPVFPALYQEYKKYNWKNIPKLLFYRNIFEQDILTMLEKVWKKYGNYTADELEYMTHCELPWQEVRKNLKTDDYSNEIIKEESIYNYYISRC